MSSLVPIAGGPFAFCLGRKKIQDIQIASADMKIGVLQSFSWPHLIKEGAIAVTLVGVIRVVNWTLQLQYILLVSIRLYEQM